MKYDATAMIKVNLEKTNFEYLQKIVSQLKIQSV